MQGGRAVLHGREPTGDRDKRPGETWGMSKEDQRARNRERDRHGEPREAEAGTQPVGRANALRHAAAAGGSLHRQLGPWAELAGLCALVLFSANMAQLDSGKGLGGCGGQWTEYAGPRAPRARDSRPDLERWTWRLPSLNPAHLLFLSEA